MVHDELIDQGGHKELTVTDGEELKLKGKGLYFIRTTPPGKAVNTNGTSDNEILFGEISEHTITSLNILVNSVFKPFVERLDNNDWGQCGEEQKKEFT